MNTIYTMYTFTQWLQLSNKFRCKQNIAQLGNAINLKEFWIAMLKFEIVDIFKWEKSVCI